MRRIKILLIVFTLFFIHNKIFSQEVGVLTFYQADRLFYTPRPGLAISYIQKFKNVFSLELEYGSQYINQTYSISNIGFSQKVKANDFLHNSSLNFLVSVYNGKKLEVQVGSKHSLFLLTGKEKVHSLELDYTNDTSFTLIEKDYERNPLETYYSYSNELRFKIKEVFIPKISVNLNLSAGFIFNGARNSGCVIMPIDIWAPYGRFGVGVSYNFNK